ncbi:hypothetical protein V8C40DRAFT_260159 [Trichoderma camerunense]
MFAFLTIEDTGDAVSAAGAPPKLNSMDVVDRRQVCDKAIGSGLSFAGTRGALEAVPSTLSIPIASLKKSIRCVACTAREEEVGDRRSNEELIDSPLLTREAVKSPEDVRRSNEELIDSPLLTRTAVKSPEDVQHFKEIIKGLRNSREECPYHTTSTSTLRR